MVPTSGAASGQSCVHADTCGRDRTSSRAAVANTTGVSRTTVRNPSGLTMDSRAGTLVA